MPRYLLPNAPYPKQCVRPAVSAPQMQSQALQAPGEAVEQAAAGPASIQEQSVASENTTKASMVGDVLQSFGQKPASAKPPEIEEQAVVDSNPVSKSREIRKPVETGGGVAPNFSLSIWRIESDLMIIDTRDVKQALPTDRLLSNILLALGYRLPALPAAKVLKWPMIENDMSEQSAENARDMLHAFLDAQLLLDPVKHIWLLGSAAASYILPEEYNYPQVIEDQLHSEELLQLEALATPVRVTVSLVDMLLDPLLKAETWRLLQALIVQR